MVQRVHLPLQNWRGKPIHLLRRSGFGGAYFLHMLQVEYATVRSCARDGTPNTGKKVEKMLVSIENWQRIDRLARIILTAQENEHNEDQTTINRENLE